MKIKNLMLLFTLFCISNSVFAQEASCNTGEAIRTTNIEVLAKKLTSNIDDDSIKVCRIYGWITSNIEYDIKKAGNFNYKRNDMTKILKKRTAICLGYADLFNKLCKLSGIESVLVPGYVKSGGWVQGDSFYHAYHVWNAAKVNGIWYMFDATWDAGYIVGVRRTWKGRLLRIISFGYINVYYFKPKFKQSPETKYYMKSGKAFSLDHLALHPIWQLMDTIITEKQFSQDSTAFFNKTKPDIPEYKNEKLQTARDNYANLPEIDQWIESGRSSHAFLNRNHLNYADALNLSAMKLVDSIDLETMDSAAVNPVCRKALKYCDSAKKEYASTLVKMADEKKMYVNSVKRIKDLCNIQNKQIIKTSKNTLKVCQKSHRQIINSIGFINNFISTTSQARQEMKGINYDKIPWADKETDLKSKKVTLMDNEFNKLNDTMAGLRKEMDKLENLIFKVWDDNEFNTSGFYDNNQWSLNTIERKAKSRFFHGSNDLNFEYSQLRDSLLNNKAYEDKLLLVGGRPLADSLAGLFKVLSLKSKQMHKMYKKQLDLLSKIKMSSVQDDEITDKFNEFTKSYSEYMAAEDDWVNEWRKPIVKIQEDYIKSAEMIENQISLAKWEMQLEKRFQSGRKEWTKDFFSGSKEVVSNNLKLAKTTARESTKIMKKVSKEG
jgi:hypothetical protein